MEKEKKTKEKKSKYLRKSTENKKAVTANINSGNRITEKVAQPGLYFSKHIRKSEILKVIRENEESCMILNDIFKITNLSNKKLANKVYEMTPKTLSSYKKEGKYFNSRIIEISIKIEELYKKGIEVFITTNNFNNWLEKENYGLGEEKPINFLKTSTGIDLVYEELVRIEYGDTA